MDGNRFEAFPFKGKVTRRRLLVSTWLGAVGAFLAACGGGSNGGGGSAAADDGRPPDVTVKMLGTSSQTFRFEPNTIELKAGTEVVLLFVNESAQPHSFRIDGVVRSDVIKNPGSKATSTDTEVKLTFMVPNEPGEKMFYCSAHGPQSESGKVIIT